MATISRDGAFFREQGEIMGDDSTIKERAVETLMSYIWYIFNTGEEIDWEEVRASVTNTINNMCFEMEMLDIEGD